MLVVLVGMVLLFASPNIGIFVIILGVMVWTSGKSRRSDGRRPVGEKAARDDQGADLGPGAQIIAIRRDARPRRSPGN
jgi:hypothetical protein